MKKLLVIFILLLLPLVVAQENYNEYEEINVKVTIENEIDLVSANPKLNYLETELLFLPKDNEYQNIDQNVDVSPEGDFDLDDTLTIRWNDNADTYSYSFESLVTRERYFVEIDEKVDFPVLEVDDDYIEATEFIDINDAIEDKALEIVQGEDDLYKAVFKLADWVEQNIEYDLNTLTEDAVQKSSWVLENEEGVCDELTNLFISLSRSVGIPAKFVSGMAYTNLADEFGAHGWSEVYIDGKWVPVDVTYGQFGWVDPTHIKFQEGFDSGAGSASFRWQGSNLDFEIGELDVKTELVNVEEIGEEYVEMDIAALVDNVGGGSYVPVQVQLKNLKDFYVPVKVALVKAPEVIGSNVGHILLLPNEEKSVFFVVKVEDSPEDNLIYTTLIEAVTMYGGSVSGEFSYSTGNEAVTKEEAEEMIDMLSIDEEINQINVDISCFMDKEVYYEEEVGSLSCEIVGDVDEVCFGEDCQKRGFVWDIDLEDYNSQRYVVVAKKDGGVKYAYFDLHILRDPDLQINVEPISFDFQEEVEFTITLESDSELKDLVIDIKNYGQVKIEVLKREYSFSLPVEGRRFAQGIKYSLSYSDELDREYFEEGKVEVEVTNVPFIYKLYFGLVKLITLN